MTARRLTKERLEEIRSYLTDNNGNRWWAELGHGDGYNFCEDLLAEVEALAADLDRERWQHAACLSYADGFPGRAIDESPAMVAVRELRARADRYREALEKEAASGAIEWGMRDETEFAGFTFKLTHHEDGSVTARLAADPKETK